MGKGGSFEYIPDGVHVLILRVLNEPHRPRTHDLATTTEEDSEHVPAQRVRETRNRRIASDDEHEHRSDNPVVERRRQRRVLHEHQSGLKADLWEEPYRAQIQYYTTTQREDNQFDDDKGGDLCQLLVSFTRFWMKRRRG